MKRWVVVALLAACGAAPAKLEHTPAAPAQPTRRSAINDQQATIPKTPQVIHLEPMRIEVITDDQGREQVVAYDAGELFDAGNEALIAGRYERALGHYDQLLEDFPDSDLTVPALYNAGLAHEEQGEWDAAVRRYADLATRQGTPRDLVDGVIRMAAVLAELQRWPDAAKALDELLERDDLTPSDRIEGLARLGYVLVESKDYAGAEDILRSAVGYYAEIRDREVLRSDYFVAMSQYYLAQIPHRQFSAIPIRLPDKQTKRDMEAKADRILIAHDRYLETVELANPYWASAAGFQIASMQKEMWDALVLAPIPPRLGPEAAEFYVKEVHRLSRQFLEKALDTHQKNAALDGRGIRTDWTDASKREADKIADILARESTGELVLPASGSGGALHTLDIDPGSASPGSGRRSPAAYVPGRVDL